MIKPITFSLMCLATVATAQVDVATPAPVLHLADNLDEARGLGWCIDTIGRGFSQELHVHSCKPQGGDVQFTYLPTTQQIGSVAFDRQCMTLIDANATVAFGLRDCDASAAQSFGFDAQTGQISPLNADNLCVAAGETIRDAGPFQSRDLILTACANVPQARKRWVHKT